MDFSDIIVKRVVTTYGGKWTNVEQEVQIFILFFFWRMEGWKQDRNSFTQGRGLQDWEQQENSY